MAPELDAAGDCSATTRRGMRRHGHAACRRRMAAGKRFSGTTRARDFSVTREDTRLEFGAIWGPVGLVPWFVAWFMRRRAPTKIRC